MRKLHSLVRKKTFNKYGYSYGALQDIKGSFGHDADANGSILLAIYKDVPNYLDETWAAKWNNKFAEVNSALCWGNCNYDFDESMDMLKAMATFFANAHSEVPDIFEPWNAYMQSLGLNSYQVYVNNEGVGRVGNVEDAAPNGSNDNASNGNTDDDSKDKSSMLPYYVGGGIISLGVLVFLVTRMQK